MLSTPQAIQDLLNEFFDVVYFDKLAASEPGLSVFAKPLHLDPEKLSSAQADFSTMEKGSIIRHSNSPWSSPLHMVKKKMADGVLAKITAV